MSFDNPREAEMHTSLRNYASTLNSQVAKLVDATELVCKGRNPQRNENTTITINCCGK